MDYVHNGFLVPVMGPALHKVRDLPAMGAELPAGLGRRFPACTSACVGGQGAPRVPRWPSPAPSCSHPQTSIEEMIASTAYLDLFLRSVSETALLKTFLRFVLLHRHDNSTILDTLVGRINSNSRVRGARLTPQPPELPQPWHCPPAPLWAAPWDCLAVVLPSCPTAVPWVCPAVVMPSCGSLTSDLSPALHGVPEPLPDAAQPQLRGCHAPAGAQVTCPVMPVPGGADLLLPRAGFSGTWPGVSLPTVLVDLGQPHHLPCR